VQRCDEKELEKLFNITYLPHLEYAHFYVETYLQKKCRKAHARGRIGDLAIWLGQLHAKELKERAIPDVTIQWMGEKKGYGVLANKAFKRWTFIGEYTGVVRRRRIMFPDLNDYCFMYPREWISLKAFTIDSEREGNFTRFINHGDCPNLESIGVFYDKMMHIMFRTIKDIAPGEELTYDYGDVYWDKREKAPELIYKK